MKTSLGLTSRLDTTENKISETEDSNTNYQNYSTERNK